MFAESDRLAKQLIQSGIERGDRVGIWSTNNSRWFEILLAVSKVGAILVNMMDITRTKELEHLIIIKNKIQNRQKAIQKVFPDAKTREIKKAATALVNEEVLIFFSTGSTTMYGMKGRGQTEDH